jgi:uncharacterized protein (DUF169 family)
LPIFDKFKLEKPPAGVKFQYFKREGIKKVDRKLAFCEMIKEAQQRGAPAWQQIFFIVSATSLMGLPKS